MKQLMTVFFCLLFIFLIGNVVHYTFTTQYPRDIHSVCTDENPLYGIAIQPFNKKFRALGGSGHLFHLIERLISQVKTFRQFREKIINFKVKKGNILYILFAEKNDVESLGAFGRLLLSALATGATGGQRKEISFREFFPKIIFGYSTLTSTVADSNKKRSSTVINIDNVAKRTFTIRDADNESIFARNYSDKKRNDDLFFLESHLFTPHFTVDFMNQNDKELFVLSADTGFTTKKTQICINIAIRVSLDNMNKKFEWFDASFETFKLFRNWVFDTCDSSRGGSIVTNRDGVTSINVKNASNTAHITSISNHISQRTNRIHSISTTKVSSSLISDNVSTLISSDDLNIGNSEIQNKIRRSVWKNKAADSPLIDSPIIINQTMPLKVLFYQRDSSRKLLNMEKAVKNFQNLLSERWTVETMVHSSERSPCDTIDVIRFATVLVTPHGFQSVLLLFQPYSSVLIEVHPSFYLKEEVYGFIQGGLRQNFKIARSYLAEESITLNSVTKYGAILLKTVGFQAHDCLHHKVCRFISRLQNVEMSEILIKRSVKFLLTHFI